MNFVVGEQLDGISVQNFLRRHCNVSARLLTKLKRISNGITQNGYPVRSIDILHSGDIVSIQIPYDHNEIIPVALPVETIYEDNSLIVFNKPPHMPVHPVHNHQLDTLANAATYYSRSKGENYAFRAVNRLDRDTSGLVLCAKSSYAVTFLAQHTKKIYIALCEGVIKGSGTIDQPLRIKQGHTIQREIGEGGVRAITHYQAITSAYGHTLTEFRLETGRTHQIRAHMSGIGHPLAGDDMYGGSRKFFDRQCLHCCRLTFLHPETQQLMTIERVPDDWMAILKNKFV